MSLAARQYRVFYWEEPVWHAEGELALQPDGGLGRQLEIIQENSNLWVIRPHLTWGIDFEDGQRVLISELKRVFSIDHFVLWYYTPMAIGFSNDLQPEATVYDCMDELKNFLDSPPKLAENELLLFRQADVVFTGGISLYQAKRNYHPNVHAFPSSIDIPHFAAAVGIHTDPTDQAIVPHPRAGFFGVIDERFDAALLCSVARLRPSVHFIILGPVVKIDPATLPQAHNIHYLGSKPYAELPAYLAGWDVAIMPFAINDATQFISPTKTPEYLAGGKPVVSTPIFDVVQEYGSCGLVRIAETPVEFAVAIDGSLNPTPRAWRKAVKIRLAKSSWLTTWNLMQEKISLALRPTSDPVKSTLRSQGYLSTNSAIEVLVVDSSHSSI